LGASVSIDSGRKVLDIGTGTGLLSGSPDYSGD